MTLRDGGAGAVLRFAATISRKARREANCAARPGLRHNARMSAAHHHGPSQPSLANDPHDHHADRSQGSGRAFSVSVALNVALVGFQVVVGWKIGSLALLGDAGHNASDILGLLTAWGASLLAMRRPDARHTYGFARSTILAALFNALVLLLTCLWLALESWRHLQTQPPVPGFWVMVAAAVGFLVNAGSAALFYQQGKADINLRGAFLHLAVDAGVSLMVVVVGGLLLLTGWSWLDPVAGLLISVVIFISAFGLLRDATDLALDAVPHGLHLDELRSALEQLEGVERAHDLHVWALSTTVAALTVHLEYDGDRDGDQLLATAQTLLAKRFGILHSTIQLERQACASTACESKQRH